MKPLVEVVIKAIEARAEDCQKRGDALMQVAGGYSAGYLLQRAGDDALALLATLRDRDEQLRRAGEAWATLNERHAEANDDGIGGCPVRNCDCKHCICTCGLTARQDAAHVVLDGLAKGDGR